MESESSTGVLILHWEEARVSVGLHTYLGIHGWLLWVWDRAYRLLCLHTGSLDGLNRTLDRVLFSS